MIESLMWALAMGLIGAVAFSAIGLVSGTDETAVVAPITLLVVLLTPIADEITDLAPWIFAGAALLIAYTSRGRWAAAGALFPFVLLVVGLSAFATQQLGHGLSISFFLGIAIG